MKKKTNFKFIIMVLLVLFISIGFAYLSSNLSITGGALVKKVDWNIYFYNIKNINGSEFIVTAPTTSGNRTKNLNFKVALEDPGDSYSFNVDVINNGNVDAMVSLINNTYDTLTDIQKKLFKINITYSDGALIEAKNFLGAGSLDTFNVTVTYSRDIEISDLPSDDIELTVDISLEYIQAKEADSKRNDKIKYSVVKDLSGNGNNGVMYGGVIRNDDGTVTTDGVDDYINCGLNRYDFGSTISYVLRFQLLNDVLGSLAIVGNGDSAGGGVDLYPGNLAQAIIYVKEQKKYAIYKSSTPLEKNRWYTLVMTVDENNLALYINGHKEGTVETNGRIKVSPVSIYIGANSNHNDTQAMGFVNATYSDALIFDRALTPEEVATDYAGEVNPTNTDQLLLHYDFK